MKLILLTALIVVIYHGCHGSINRVSIWMDGQELISDLTLDRTTNTSTIYFPRSYILFGLPLISTVNLHDYNNGWLAYKNIMAGFCLLKHLDEDIQEMYDLLEQTRQGLKHSPPPEYASVNETQVPHTELLSITGKRIYDFCYDYKTYWLVPQNNAKRSSTKGTSTNKKKPRCWINCYHCSDRLETSAQFAKDELQLQSFDRLDASSQAIRER